MDEYDYHDRILRRIELLWDERRVTVVIDGNASIMANGVVDVHVPHRDPWGSSHSINETSLETLKDAFSTLQIEMQSGDIIRIVARTFEFRGGRSDAGSPQA